MLRLWLKFPSAAQQMTKQEKGIKVKSDSLESLMCWQNINFHCLASGVLGTQYLNVCFYVL